MGRTWSVGAWCLTCRCIEVKQKTNFIAKETRHEALAVLLAEGYGRTRCHGVHEPVVDVEVSCVCEALHKEICMIIEIYPDRKAKWRWRAKSSNGRKVAASGESFANKANTERSVDSFLQGLDHVVIQIVKK